MTRLAVTLALVAVCASPTVVGAQRGGGAPARGENGVRGIRVIPPEHPQVPRPAPSINQPSFPINDDLNRPSFPINEDLNRPSFTIIRPLGFGSAQPSPFAAGRTFTRRSRGPRAFGIPLGYGGYGSGVPAYGDTSTRQAQQPPQEEELATGILFLDVTPRTTMVFIDSAFVGNVDDLFFDGVRLSRGRHWLELEAPGYEKNLVEINITAGQPLRYRVDLTPVRQAALTVIPPRPPETMYAIPGCYGGNRPPVAASLPPGCDISKVRVIRPQPRVN